MIWNVALIALASVFSLAAILALVGNFRPTPKNGAGPLELYMLGGGALKKVSIINLLLSSSFGLNAVFYQIWLGYAVGFWGMVAQICWGLSFLFLSRYVTEIRSGKSLHDYIGARFGYFTRLVAGLCSLIGIMFLMGWEVSIGSATYAGIFALEPGFDPAKAGVAAEWLSWGIVLGCLLYTVLGGLKGNATADVSQNAIKIISLIVVAGALGFGFWQAHDVQYIEKFFPKWETMAANLGFWALVTNIVFSICWQFVDTSTWQSVIASSRASEEDSRWNLVASGAVVVFFPGIVGTLIGIFLSSQSGITQDNILVKAIAVFPYASTTFFVVFVTMIAATMSLLDGLFLASAYTLVIDVLHPRKRLVDLDKDEKLADRVLVWMRIALLIVAVLGVWGTAAFATYFGKTLFDLVYVVIIPQLALIGAVVASFWGRQQRQYCPMALSILIGVSVGFGCSILGPQNELPWVSDGAGTATVIASYLSALMCSSSKRSDDNLSVRAVS